MVTSSAAFTAVNAHSRRQLLQQNSTYVTMQLLVLVCYRSCFKPHKLVISNVSMYWKNKADLEDHVKAQVEMIPS